MRYRFAGCLLDTATLELTRQGEPEELEPQAFSVLAHLVANHDRVVSKQELLDEVWDSRFVSESALTTRIKQARRAVGDTGEAQSVIRTVHGRGYRLVAEVTEETRRPEPSGTTVSPRTRYAHSDGVSIAYQTFGEGPDLLIVAGYVTNVEVQWEVREVAAGLSELARHCRVTVLDKRGVGLSDRIPGDCAPSLEIRAADMAAVLDDAGIERATVLGSSEGGSLAAVFAAAHPERISGLILHNTWLRGPTIDEPTLDAVTDTWGRGAVLGYLAPSIARTKEGRRALARFERQSASPLAARHLLELISALDIGDVLAAIGVPTLVLHREGDEVVPFESARRLAAAIPGSRLVKLAGSDHFLFSGELGETLGLITAFATGRSPEIPTDRFLATVVFVDIVDATGTAQRMGDGPWTALLDRFYDVAGRTTRLHGGTLVNTTGDGVVSTFDGPGRGVRAAGEMVAEVGELGVQIRAGVHTAEIQRRGSDIAGLGVHIASRVASAAEPGQVWVSRTVTDLVAGCGLAFDPKGEHRLKGIEEPWSLFAAAS